MNKIIILILNIIISAAVFVVTGCSDFKGPSKKTKEGASDINWQYAYDERGRVKEMASPGKRVMKFLYEDDEKTGLARRITRQDGEGNKVVYEMDILGRCVKMSDPVGSTNYIYDKDNRLTGVQRDKGPKISYSYDSENRLYSMSLGEKGAMKLTYNYDFFGRISVMTTPKGNITYEYQAGAGRVIRTLPNGIRTVFDYQPDGRLKIITHVARDNKILARFAHGYRPDGLIKEVAEWMSIGERKIDYSYDEVQRLSVVNDSRFGKTEFYYDRLGNRLTFKVAGKQGDTYAYDWSGKMTSRGGKACRYDAAYNFVNCGGPKEPQFEYDMLNSLKTVTKNGVRVMYQYDGEGVLLARTEQDRQTRFVPDPMSASWRPLMMQSTGGKDTFYIWAGDTPLMSISGNDVQFLLHDHLGSVRSVVDQNGTVVGNYNYSPFGLPQQSVQAVGLQPGFAGLFYDPVAAVYLTKARAYDPKTGRFLQIDPQFRVPKGSQKDFSPYVYCGNDPANFVDRDGAEPSEARKNIDGLLTAVAHNMTGPYYTPLDLTQTLLSMDWKNEVVPWYRESDYVINQLLSAARENTGQPTSKGAGVAESYRRAWETMHTWRYHTETRPKWLGKVSEYEWRIAENRLFAMQFTLTGKTVPQPPYNLFDNTPPGKFAANVMTNVMIPGWKIVHVLGETLDYLKHTQDFLPQTPKSITEQLQGVQDGREIIQKLQESKNLTNVIMKQMDRARGTIQRYDISGGSGRVAGPGGFASSGAETAAREFGGHSRALSPSNVGGIYMRGAGEALKNMGAISGISLDENGRLILLSEGGPAVGLPPLRMDDIVSIFRSVYQNGAPFVSIDPDPKNPEGPTMLVRHDEGTARTYAGWVLFEADRVMKAYSLGSDNITRTKITSGIPGYQSVLDMGFSNTSGANQGPIWERFWIVPAEVKRYQAANNRLSIFDVPLKVNTQRMILKNGKLEPAPGKEPSPSARTFSTWFTRNYDQIARESKSNPVKGSDMQAPVAVFTELRRIALLTAIAENLRDQGVPLPAWIQNYSVKPFPVPTTTPSITIEASKTEARTIKTQQIYGGVRLAPEDKDIRVIKASRDIETLRTTVNEKMMSVPSLTPVAVAASGKNYQALAFPGENTSDLGGNQILETDLVVPVQRGNVIGLTREFNSFFQPQDVWGNGWTMNPPRLEKVRQPVKRIGDQTSFQTSYQLVSPLGSYSESFREIRFVPEVNGKIMVPQKQGSVLGLAETTKKEIGVPTTEMIFRDGSQWHFDAEGYLAAQVNSPEMVIYRRDSARRIFRIEGWYGKYLRADIRIEYDKQGRIVVARGSNKEEVKYTYNNLGQLHNVKRKSDKLEYVYTNGLVTSVKVDGKEVRGYVYDLQGRLMQEKLPRGIQRTFAYQGRQATSTSDKASDISEYDSTMRPLKRHYANGTLAQWQYPGQDKVITSVTPPDGKRYQVISTNDGRHVDWLMPDGRTSGADYDAAGRITALREAGRTLVQQQWHANGLPGATLYESFAVRPQYTEDNVLDRMLITPPGNQQQFNQWIEIAYNELGYPGNIRDYCGAETIVYYGRSGQPAALKSKQGTIQMTYDDKGRTETVKASWGTQYAYSYDKKTGMVKEIEFTAGGKNAGVKFKEGNPVVMEQFDGGKYKFYYDKSRNSHLKGVRTPNNVELKYGYDTSGRVRKVHCDGTYAINFFYDEKGRLTGLSRVPLL